MLEGVINKVKDLDVKICSVQSLKVSWANFKTLALIFKFLNVYTGCTALKNQSLKPCVGPSGVEGEMRGETILARGETGLVGGSETRRGRYRCHHAGATRTTLYCAS